MSRYWGPRDNERTDADREAFERQESLFRTITAQKEEIDRLRGEVEKLRAVADASHAAYVRWCGAGDIDEIYKVMRDMGKALTAAGYPKEESDGR